MRDDVLAKRLFYGGCLGLPWLWLVQVMYWYGKERQDSQEEQSNQEALLNNADTNDEDDASGQSQLEGSAMSDYEVKAETKKWVKRSLYGAISLFGLWVSWIIVFQIFSDDFGPKWFVRTENEGDRTRW